MKKNRQSNKRQNVVLNPSLTCNKYNNPDEEVQISLLKIQHSKVYRKQALLKRVKHLGIKPVVKQTNN